MAETSPATSRLDGVIRINVNMAMNRLTSFKINLLRMFDGDEETGNNLAQILYVQDNKLVDLYKFCYNEIHKRLTTYEHMELVGGDELEAFRGEVWEAIENFSGPRRRNLVRELRFQMEETFKSMSLKESSSDSQVEPETPPGNSP